MLKILEQQKFAVYCETFFFGDDDKNKYMLSNINNPSVVQYDGRNIITEKSVFGQCFFKVNLNGKILSIFLTDEVLFELNHDILEQKVKVKPKSVGNKWKISFHSDEYDDFLMKLDWQYKHDYIEQYKVEDSESIELILKCINELKDAFISAATVTIQDQFNRHFCMNNFMKLQRIIVGNLYP